MLLRLGFNSKAVITGDITQIDLPENKVSGLIEIQGILKGIEGIEGTETEKDPEAPLAAPAENTKICSSTFLTDDARADPESWRKTLPAATLNLDFSPFFMNCNYLSVKHLSMFIIFSRIIKSFNK
jgi:hypothetical protein